MTKNQKYSIIPFLTIQLALYILILFIDTGVTYILEFLTIALAFVFSFMFYSSKNKSYFTHTALLFTVISDIFLVLCDPQLKTLSMLSFSIVQIMYCIRIMLETHNKKVNNIHLITRICITTIVLVITAIVLKKNTDFLSMVSMFYFTNLALNVIMAFCNKDSSILFKVGLFLFMLCDIFVGLGQIEIYLALQETSFIYKLSHTSFNFVWLFYVPAQTLLSLSLINTNKKPHTI